jgi:hypothetical protein
MDYKKVYDQIIERAQKELTIRKEHKKQGTYYEGHHIVPKSLNGTGRSQNWNHPNIVPLTPREHFLCHHLLMLMYPDNMKIVAAYWAMCNQKECRNNKRHNKITSREYEYARTLFQLNIKNRKVTWGNKISESKKGISIGKRSIESVEKQKQTVRNNPYRHPEHIRQGISERTKDKPKSEETKRKISETNKKKGIKPPYKGKPVTVNGITYRSHQEASRVLGIPAYRLVN